MFQNSKNAFSFYYPSNYGNVKELVILFILTELILFKFSSKLLY